MMVFKKQTEAQAAAPRHRSLTVHQWWCITRAPPPGTQMLNAAGDAPPPQPGPPSLGLNIVRESDNNLAESHMFIQKPV